MKIIELALVRENARVHVEFALIHALFSYTASGVNRAKFREISRVIIVRAGARAAIFSAIACARRNGPSTYEVVLLTRAVARGLRAFLAIDNTSVIINMIR